MKMTYKGDNESIKRQQNPSDQLSFWQKLVYGVVRPPRSTVADPLSTVTSFRMNEILYTRSEYTILHDDKKIRLFVIDPQNKNNWIILYLHGNSSSKVQSYAIRQYLPLGYSMASFDFMGCGRNFEEDTITLGYRQAQQVEAVVKFLKNQNYKIVIWGRSMGAATALRFGKANVIVADSAFKSFRGLCKQFAKANTPCFIPNCLISCLFPCIFCKIRSQVQKLAHYDVQELNTAESLKSISLNTMLIFLSGDEDNLIDKRNSQKLYQLFEGRHKHLLIFKGNHNSKRPPEVLKKAMDLIQQFNSQYDRGLLTGQSLKNLPNSLQL